MRWPARIIVALSLAIGCQRRESAPVAPPEPALEARAVTPAPDPPLVELTRVDGFSRESSPLVLAKAGSRELAFVALEGSVNVVDLATGVAIGAYDFPCQRAELLLLPDGRLACASPMRGDVPILAWRADRALHVDEELKSVDGPRALALSPDDAVLYIAGDREAVVEGVRLADHVRTMRAATERGPRSLIVADGNRLFVAQAASSDVLVIDTNTGVIETPTSLDTDLLTVQPLGEEMLEPTENGKQRWVFANGMETNWARQARLAVPVKSRHAYGFTRAGAEILVAHHELVPSVPAGDLEAAKGYGGIDDLGSVSFAVTSLDMRTGARRKTYGTNRRCGLPRGAMWDPTAHALWVACEGEDMIASFTRSSLEKTDNGYRVRPLGGPFFVEQTHVRVCTGPTALARDEGHDRLVVACPGEGALWVLSLRNPKAPPQKIALSRPVVGDVAVDRGRAIFFRTDDPRVSKDGRSCATCHIEGETDHLVWTTPLGPRKTIAIGGGFAKDQRAGWNGQSANLAAHMKSTIRANLGGTGLSDLATADLEAYVQSLRPALAEWSGGLYNEGEQVFRATGCDSCHVVGSRSDGELHDIGSGGRFLTPRLRGVSGAAPYFHDGRYASLEEMLAKTAGKMGATRGLSEHDRDALVAFLRAF